MIRYDDMRVDRLLMNEYQKHIAEGLKIVAGQNDIERALRSFEADFASYIGVRYSLAVNSGTDALQLALLAMGVGKGDKVLVPNLTYPAVALSVMYVGAEPILVDANSELQLDERLLSKKLSKGTKAVIAAHMFARPCNIEAITDFAKKQGLKVIEDCCQAESSTLKGRRLGSFADISCFSFSYYKPLSSCGGGGGMVCFQDEEYRSVVGYTKMGADIIEQVSAGQRFARMNLMDLISIRVKWKYLKEIIKSRAAIRAFYEEELGRLSGIRIYPDPPEAISVAQNYVVLVDKRDALGEVLRNNAVVWQRPYTPLNTMEIFKKYAYGKYPQSAEYYEKAIHLPLFSFMKKEEAEKIVTIIKSFTKRQGR